MLVISRQQVADLIRKLPDPAYTGECRNEVETMLEIEAALLSRATDMLQPCCGSLDTVKSCLAAETSILEKTLDAIDSKDHSRAILYLQEYTLCLEALPR
jgi:hypothetical protein